MRARSTAVMAIIASTLALAACSLLNPLDGFSDGSDGGTLSLADGGMDASSSDASSFDAARDPKLDAAVPDGPVDVGAPLLWFAADHGVMATGTSVSRWADLSGGQRDAIQTVVANQPALVMDALNHHPAVAFDGSSASLSFVALIEGLPGLSFAVVSACSDSQLNGGDHLTLADAIHWNETTAWGTTFLGSYQSNVGGRFGTTQENNTLNAIRTTSIGTAFTLTIMEHDQTTDRVYADGKLVVVNAGKLAMISGTSTDGQLGSGDNNAYFAGSIAEVLVYPFALGDVKRGAVQAYIHAKYFPDRPVF